jgi:RNA polymerase sigma factor (TIGR02999 family)
MKQHADITTQLRAWQAGDPSARERLFPLVYDELRLIAHRQLQRERPGHTLDTTALVHEAYLRLAGSTSQDFSDRAHFFAMAATAMRRILVDYARR